MGDHFECEDNWWDSGALDAGKAGFACYLDFFKSSNGKVSRIHLLALAMSIANSLQQKENTNRTNLPFYTCSLSLSWFIDGSRSCSCILLGQDQCVLIP